MKKYTLIIGIIINAIIGNAAVTNYEVGDIVSDFTGTDTDGNVHNLYEITASGKYVFIDFFYDTCLPCQTKAPHFTGLYNKYGCNSGEVYCLSINSGSDSDAEVIAFTEEFGGMGHHNPAISGDGGSAAIRFDIGVTGYPTFCVIGPDNRLVHAGIWPVNSVEELEGGFPEGFNPEPMPCSFVGLNNNEYGIQNLSLYPNPAQAIISLSFHSLLQGNASINVQNILGETILSNNSNIVLGNNALDFDLSTVSTGTYLVTIQLDEAILTERITIRR